VIAEGTESEVPRGRVVGRYALYDRIGAGGVAAVHLGRLLGPAGFRRTVAIKRLRPEFAKDPDFITMLLDEARVTSRIQHPNVAPTLDVVPAEGELFVVMDYVHGESLARLSRLSDARVPPRIAAAIACGVLYGLRAAHEAKSAEGEPLEIIHRDVSPHNVIVGADGVARLVDFGIAKALGRSYVTRGGMIRGKPGYMAPEQIRGRPSQRTDLYAAAVVLWEMLSGARLFVGESDEETIENVLARNVAPPCRAMPEADLDRATLERLDAITLKGLARDESERFETAREMARALEACLAVASPAEVGEWVERVAGGPLRERAELVLAMEREAGAPPDKERAEPSRRKPIVLVAGAGLAIAAALLAANVGTRAAPFDPAAASDAVPTPSDTAPRVTEAPTLIAAPPPRTPKPRAPAPPHASARRACDPPYTLDQAGRKVFKEDCLR
jgi:serine/threonine-protein kinase